jgi:hypothetical protein
VRHAQVGQLHNAPLYKFLLPTQTRPKRKQPIVTHTRALQNANGRRGQNGRNVLSRAMVDNDSAHGKYSDRAKQNQRDASSQNARQNRATQTNATMVRYGVVFRNRFVYI